jgi:hypothetical protein
MDYQLMQQLLDKYFEGETTLQEESQLREGFQQETLPEGLEAYRPLFQFIEEEQQIVLDEQFDHRLFAQLQEKPVERTQARVRTLHARTIILQIAAVVTLMIGGWWYYQEVTTPKGIDWAKYEVQDTEEAFKITQVALLKASSELHKGTSTAAREVSNLKEIGRFFEHQ